MKKIIFFILILNVYSIFPENIVPSSDLPVFTGDLGNAWYSGQNFFISNELTMGMSGTKDFLGEIFLFSYKFVSKNRHAFSIRLYHLGYTTGLFSNHFEYFNFEILAGFEYFYKIFSYTEGFFVFTDLGGCQKGFAFNAGIGIGSRTANGFELNFSYLYDTGFFSKIDFYFLLFDFFILRGKTGIDFLYQGAAIDNFSFICGAYIGFSVKNYFRIELGGGFTVNDHNYYSGFGGLILTTSFPN